MERFKGENRSERTSSGSFIAEDELVCPLTEQLTAPVVVLSAPKGAAGEPPRPPHLRLPKSPPFPVFTYFNLNVFDWDVQSEAHRPADGTSFVSRLLAYSRPARRGREGGREGDRACQMVFPAESSFEEG